MAALTSRAGIFPPAASSAAFSQAASAAHRLAVYYIASDAAGRWLAILVFSAAANLDWLVQ
jgi:hypothetical protein